MTKLFQHLLLPATLLTVLVGALLTVPSGLAIPPPTACQADYPPPAYCPDVYEEEEEEEPIPPPPPPAPTEFAVTGTTASSVSLSWRDNAADETGYAVERVVGGYWQKIAGLNANPGSGPMSYTDAGLASGTSYRYRIAVSGPGGTVRSTVLDATTAPAPPPDPTPPAPAPFTATLGTVTAHAVDLSWTGRDGATAYAVERKVGYYTSFSEVARLSPSARAYTDTGLVGNTVYTYRIRAFDTSGAVGTTNEVTARTKPANGVETVRLTGVTNAFTYWGSVSNSLFLPEGAEITSVKNVARSLHPYDKRVTMANLAFRDKSGVTRTLARLAGGEATTAFNGQLAAGRWDLNVTDIYALYLYSGCVSSSPADYFRWCAERADISLEVAWRLP